jgi:hypothetical protein
VINNPLAFTDPNGYCFLGLCGVVDAIGSFFTNPFHAVQTLLQRVPILGNIIEIAATSICAASFGCAPFVALVAAVTTAAVAGITSGNLGVALKAGLIAGATAGTLQAVGGATGAIAQDLGPVAARLFDIGAHALVGCGASVASGDSCSSGALAAGITSAAGPYINGPDRFACLVENTVLGGAASVAGGGKFANGAVTAAFGYLTSPQAGAGGVDGASSAYAQAIPLPAPVGVLGTAGELLAGICQRPLFFLELA